MCYILWYNVPTMFAGHRQATSWVHYTTSCNKQSNAPGDGRNYRPKHVELIGIINKPLLLHLVGCLYYLFQTFNFQNCLFYMRNKIIILFMPLTHLQSFAVEQTCDQMKIHIILNYYLFSVSVISKSLI